MALEGHPRHAKISSKPENSTWLQPSDMEKMFQQAADRIQDNMRLQVESHSHFCKDVLWHLQQNLVKQNYGRAQESYDHDGCNHSIMKSRSVHSSLIQHRPADPSGQELVASQERVQNIKKDARRSSKVISSEKRRSVARKMGVTRQLVRSKTFEFMSAILILANCVFVGYQVNGNAIEHTTLGVMQLVFALSFCLELLLRLCADGQRFVTHNTLWNVFEVVTVLGSLAEVAVYYHAALVSNLNFSLLRIVRFLRGLRLLGMFRMNAFRELRLMISTIFCCFRPFLWTLLLLVIDVYLFAIGFTQCTRDAVRGDVLSSLDAAFLSDNFFTLDKSVVTLLAVLEGVTDWRTITDVLVKVHWAYAAALLLYIFTTQLALLNVITAIFVDSSMAAALTDKQMLVQDELVREGTHREELARIFAEAAEGNTHVPVHKLKHYMMDEQVKTYLQVLGIKYATARDFVDTLDVDHDGEIDFQEFVETCMKIKSGLLTDTHAVLQETSRKLTEIHSAVMDIEFQVKQYRASAREYAATNNMSNYALMSSSGSTEQIPERQTMPYILPKVDLPEDSLPVIPQSKTVSISLPRGCPNMKTKESA